jgi:L-fuculose-phosphate aldolase
MVEIGRLMYDRKLIVATEGNMSVRLSDGNILITPAGMCKGMMKPDDLVIVDLQGRKIDGAREPSSEMKMHLTALTRRPDVRACVHGHPSCATTFAILGIPLTPEGVPEFDTTIGSVPLAPYAKPSTAAVGESIAGLLDTTDAILLERHGVLTVGADLDSAYFKMETVERFAEMIWRALSFAGGDVPSPDELGELFDLSAPPATQASASHRGGKRHSSPGRKHGV